MNHSEIVSFIWGVADLTRSQELSLAVLRLQAAAGEGSSADYEDCRYHNFR